MTNLEHSNFMWYSEALERFNDEDSFVYKMLQKLKELEYDLHTPSTPVLFEYVSYFMPILVGVVETKKYVAIVYISHFRNYDEKIHSRKQFGYKVGLFVVDLTRKKKKIRHKLCEQNLFKISKSRAEKNEFLYPNEYSFVSFISDSFRSSSINYYDDIFINMEFVDDDKLVVTICNSDELKKPLRIRYWHFSLEVNINLRTVSVYRRRIKKLKRLN